jgi:hypothetical protein
LHKELGDYISSVVIVPKYSSSGTTTEFTTLLSISCALNEIFMAVTTSNEFTNLLSISSALNEIFMAVTTSNDVKIITQLAQSELVGE